MTYTFNRLRDKNGERVTGQGAPGLTLDIDRDRHAMVFSGDQLVADLRVMEFEAHANGLFLRGYESSDGGLKAVYQEWFLKYEEHES